MPRRIGLRKGERISGLPTKGPKPLTVQSRKETMTSATVTAVSNCPKRKAVQKRTGNKRYSRGAFKGENDPFSQQKNGHESHCFRLFCLLCRQNVPRFSQGQRQRGKNKDADRIPQPPGQPHLAKMGPGGAVDAETGGADCGADHRAGNSSQQNETQGVKGAIEKEKWPAMKRLTTIGSDRASGYCRWQSPSDSRQSRRR